MMVYENFLTGNVWLNDIWSIKQMIHLDIKNFASHGCFEY